MKEYYSAEKTLRTTFSKYTILSNVKSKNCNWLLKTKVPMTVDVNFDDKVLQTTSQVWLQWKCHCMQKYSAVAIVSSCICIQYGYLHHSIKDVSEKQKPQKLKQQWQHTLHKSSKNINIRQGHFSKVMYQTILTSVPGKNVILYTYPESGVNPTSSIIYLWIKSSANKATHNPGMWICAQGA